MPEKLAGLIERVTFHNPENGFAVLKVQVKGRSDLVTVVGNTTSVSAGEHLQATGRWVVDREHGQQFKADELKVSHPASTEGIEKYLASGAIRCIGPKLAAKIVGIYKERTLEILDTAPNFLLHIKGIGRQRLKRIRRSWQEQKEVRKIMLFLTEHGITSGRAVRIYRTYGQEAIAKIKRIPTGWPTTSAGSGSRRPTNWRPSWGSTATVPTEHAPPSGTRCRNSPVRGTSGFRNWVSSNMPASWWTSTRRSSNRRCRQPSATAR
jgi:ATP-dependent exoDNAse (exonuclease V) alpha subunit